MIVGRKEAVIDEGATSAPAGRRSLTLAGQGTSVDFSVPSYHCHLIALVYGHNGGSLGGGKPGAG